jgi:hypothetical protein
LTGMFLGVFNYASPTRQVVNITAKIIFLTLYLLQWRYQDGQHLTGMFLGVFNYASPTLQVINITAKIIFLTLYIFCATTVVLISP